jgi:hypothetical protein
MPTAVPPDPETPPQPSRPERRVLARAVGVWWVQRLLQAARPRGPTVPRDEDDELHAPAPAGR